MRITIRGTLIALNAGAKTTVMNFGRRYGISTKESVDKNAIELPEDISSTDDVEAFTSYVSQYLSAGIIHCKNEDGEEFVYRFDLGSEKFEKRWKRTVYLSEGDLDLIKSLSKIDWPQMGSLVGALATSSSFSK